MLHAVKCRAHYVILQVAASRDETARREADLRSLADQKDSLSHEALRNAQEDNDQMRQRLAGAQREVVELRGRHATEMTHVEGRVKAAIAKKDETISSLRQQLADLGAQLRSTESVLAAQQAELYHDM